MNTTEARKRAIARNLGAYERMILRELYNRPMTSTAIAKAIGLTKYATDQLLRTMAGAGFILAPPPKKHVGFSLTLAGRDACGVAK